MQIGRLLEHYRRLQLSFVVYYTLSATSLLLFEKFSSISAATLALLLTILTFRSETKSGYCFGDDFKSGAIILGTLIGLVFVRLPSKPYWIGGQDPGLYVGMSKQINLNRGLVFKDTFREKLSDSLKAEYDHYSVSSVSKSKGRPSYYQIDFYPILPLWLALFSLLFGDQNHNFFLIFISLGLMLTAKRLAEDLLADTYPSNTLLRRKVIGLGSLFAVLLIGVNPLALFLAKVPLTESVSSFLFLSVIVEGLSFLKGKKNLWFVLLLFLSLFLSRISFYPWILFAILSGVYLYSDDGVYRGINQKYLQIVGVLSASILLSALFYFWKMPALFEDVFVSFWRQRLTPTSVIAFFISLAGAWGLLQAKKVGRLAKILLERVHRFPFQTIVITSMPFFIGIAFSKKIKPFPYFMEGASIENFRFSLVWNLILILSPFLFFWGLWFEFRIKKRSGMTGLGLLLFCTYFLVSAFALGLPYLFYYGRYLWSEVVPVLLVIFAGYLSISVVSLQKLSKLSKFFFFLTLSLGVAWHALFLSVYIGKNEGETDEYRSQIKKLRSPIMVVLGDVDRKIIDTLKFTLNKEVFVFVPALSKITAHEALERLYQEVKNIEQTGGGQVTVLTRGAILNSVPLSSINFDVGVFTNGNHLFAGLTSVPNFLAYLLPFRFERVHLGEYHVFQYYGIQALDELTMQTEIDFSSGGNSIWHTDKGWLLPSSRGSQILGPSGQVCLPSLGKERAFGARGGLKVQVEADKSGVVFKKNIFLKPSSQELMPELGYSMQLSGKTDEIYCIAFEKMKDFILKEAQQGDTLSASDVYFRNLIVKRSLKKEGT